MSRVLRVTESATAGESRSGEIAGATSISGMSRAIWSAVAVAGGGMADVGGASAARWTGLQTPVTLLSVSCVTICTTEARKSVSWVLPHLKILNSLGLWAQHYCQGPGVIGTTLLFSYFCLLYVLQANPPIPAPCRFPFICIDMWNSLASWYVGQRYLCWVMDVLQVVDWKGETKGASHVSMMLTSLNVLRVNIRYFAFWLDR